MSNDANKPYVKMTPQEKLDAFKKQGRLQIIEVKHHSKNKEGGRSGRSHTNTEVEHGRD